MIKKSVGITPEKALSEKIMIEEIIVKRLKRNAGIAEPVSQIKETKPSGIETLNKLNIFSLIKFVTGVSNE